MQSRNDQMLKKGKLGGLTGWGEVEDRRKGQKKDDGFKEGTKHLFRRFRASLASEHEKNKWQ
jgi:hypothetical protein